MLDTTTAFGRTLQEIAEAHGFSGADGLVRAANHEGRPMEDFPWMGFGSDLETVIGVNEEERARVVETFARTWLGKKDEGGEPEAGGTVFPVGGWERPDPAGIVRRGGAVWFTDYVTRYGEPPVCFVGSRPGEACDRPAVMEVYGIAMCKQHGEEAASGALEEIAYDLENELQRPMNDHVRRLSPHLVRALRHGFGSLPEGASDHDRADAALLAAFPLDRSRVSAEVLAYAEDPDGRGRGRQQSPYDAFMSDRLLLCRHMRLAYEEDADWLVEMLETEREKVAAQAAYALALDREAGDQPA